MPGTPFVDGRIPGQVIGIPSVEVSDSGSVTTVETVVNTLSAVPVVSGRTYNLEFRGLVRASSGVDVRCALRIRLTNVSGTEVAIADVAIPHAGSLGAPFSIKVPWTAGSTGTQTFVGTVVRTAGSTNVVTRGSTITPRVLEAYYKSG